MKVSQKKIIPLLLLLLLSVTMLHVSLLIVWGITIFVMIICELFSKRLVRKNFFINKGKKYSIFILFTLVFFYLIQIVCLDLNLSEASYALCILCAIFIFVFVQLLLGYSLSVKYAFVRAICWFNILFSSFYIFRIVLYGLPEDRNSVLGYVSSNYCAAILYLSFPLLLYSLCTIKKSNNEDAGLLKKIYFSLVLSIIVILLSGSRTALGVLLLICLALSLYKQNIKKKIKTILVLLITFLIVSFFYQRMPGFQSLLDRALDILQGKETVDNDIRTVAWEYAIANFENYNKIVGSGSNMVPQLGRPAHNFFLEMLLSIGFSGLLLFAVSITFTIIRALSKLNYEKKFFITLLFGLVLIVSYVQPFFTTAFTCGIIVWGTFFYIVSEE